ncbi:1-(5-phosphoribosyl)-5-[(5-phosphoribosylamino)methylideneamino] imidazole-4-carboxamide isomerase [Aliiruegeria haliotis]|uniref:1-(5-phosphoribosyl)-5-[(5-phosphoribosylamino)methylideneamino] imidazole-4-carboxamide isomerase n=1 Tax=Aliiruegeria haliotis TaxID=1280846 RepID=A0A2T0RMY6_9RHOB|nr:1-(5-phosphoribosyl)-5-[(5-phosphoribosylamino)methylideneamino] imidazole-4-carboxamide isomerase [Aliiruegeria haliotis]PRY22566.1 1-(5-phosphoribosyl)-5-[(5-phosphoribosylamino)methylideneamino] imidazole-4-carboxamide isomerase [Aliiruegeria haliotis]
MILYPTIELLDGRCVSLFRGNIDEPQIWHVDPLERAISFAQAGAEWIHITDFDGVGGSDRNTELLREIIGQCGTSVQLGGGFRSLQSIADWIEAGAGRIVVGTLAVLAPDIVKEAAKLFPDQIVLAIDVYKGKVVSNGWRETSSFEPEDLLRVYESDPLAAIIVTDIDADLDEAEDSLALITRMAEIARAPVIASGLSRSIDDLARLKYVPHISGAIIGRALFNRSVALEDALALVAEPTGPTAKFQ